jgi:GNAT superfamily N-acetyltransferase
MEDRSLNCHFPSLEAEHDEYLISTSPARMDVSAIHSFLTRSYWSPGIPPEIVARAVANSLCVGLFVRNSGQQIGFARFITDAATFAYLCDVYVLEEYRGRGLAGLLLEKALAYPALQGVRRMVLVTRDGHGLYARYGFCRLANPGSYMEIHKPDIYVRPSNSIHSPQ